MTSLPIESLKLVDEDPKRHSGAPGDVNTGLNFSGTYCVKFRLTLVVHYRASSSAVSKRSKLLKYQSKYNSLGTK